MNRRKKHFEIALLSVIDLVAILLVLGIAFLIRAVFLPAISPNPWQETNTEHLRSSAWIVLVWMLFFYHEGLYTKRFSFWDEVKMLWKVSFFSTVGAFVVVSMAQLSHLVPRTLIVLTGLVSLALVPLVRIQTRRFLKRYGLFKRRVVIVGAGELGRLCLRALRRESNFGYDVVGFIDDDPHASRVIDGVKVHKGIDKTERYIRPGRISDVFIAIPEIDKTRVQELINRIQFRVERILLVPDLQSVPMLGTEIHHYFHDRIFSIEIKNNLEKTSNIIIKRIFDELTSLIVLLFLLMPMTIISLAIMIESPGSPIYRQTRIGRNGRSFKIFKFRTMYENSEDRLRDFLRNDKKARENWEQFWKLRNDPRVTKIGAFLRRTSLDELPQLINVLLGQMSLVGPRPYLPEEVESLPKDKLVFLRVPPGITGLWQVNGRSDTVFKYRLAIDAWYVRNWTLWLDIVILVKTVKVVAMREGAY